MATTRVADQILNRRRAGAAAMKMGPMQNAIDAFVQTLAVEKGYSQHTCRAYRHDLEEFSVYFVEISGSSHRSGPDAVKIEQVDAMTIRGYLGHLHKKNTKNFQKFFCPQNNHKRRVIAPGTPTKIKTIKSPGSL